MIEETKRKQILNEIATKFVKLYSKTDKEEFCYILYSLQNICAHFEDELKHDTNDANKKNEMTEYNKNRDLMQETTWG